MKMRRIFKFDDTSCVADSDGVIVARQLLGNAGGNLEPVTLPAEENVTLGFGYIEARHLQNRQCSETLTFRPVANESYTAAFSVTGQSRSCSVRLTDSQGRQVATATPATSCVLGLMKKKLPNGQGGILNWKLEFVPW